MHDLWSVASNSKRISLPGSKKNKIGMFDPISGQSINPDEREHASLLRNVSEALVEQEERINRYQERAFHFEPPKNKLEQQCSDPLSEDSQLSRESEPISKKSQVKKQKYHQTKNNIKLAGSVSNNIRRSGCKENAPQGQPKNPSRTKKIIIPEVTEVPPFRPCAILPSSVHPLDMVHKRMRCRGLISNRKPIFNKRFHRSIRFKWSWVPYYRNHITTLRKNFM